MKLQDSVFGVQVTNADGTKVLANGGKGSIYALFYRASDAKLFSRELRYSGFAKTKVVPITSTVEWEAK